MKNKHISKNKKNTENAIILYFCKSLMSGFIEGSWILISAFILL